MPKLGAKKIKSALKKRPLIFFILYSLVLVFFSFLKPNLKVCSGSECYLLDIASTQDLREKGLSGRESLAQNKGMIFEHQEPGKYCFWMKDMKFPIDIIWLDENKKIIKIAKNIKPESYPEQFCPEVPALYVIEIQAGSSDRNNLAVGQKLQF